MQAMLIASYLAVGGLVRLAYEDYKIGSSKVKTEFVTKKWPKIKKALKEAISYPHRHLFL